MTSTAGANDGEVAREMAFFGPWESAVDVGIRLAAEGEGTKVTWTFDEEANLMMKVMGLFMSMEDMLGGDYEQGLANLESAVETAVAERRAAEEAARLAEEEAAEGEGEPVAEVTP